MRRMSSESFAGDHALSNVQNNYCISLQSSEPDVSYFMHKFPNDAILPGFCESGFQFVSLFIFNFFVVFF